LKFTTERDNFADAVAWVSRTVSTRPTLPVLGGTLVELEGNRLRLASTDLEHTGEAVIEVRGEADGRVVVPGRIFGDVARNLPTGLVEVEAADGGLEVRRGQITHELRLLDAEDFPTLTQPSLEHVGTLSGEALAGAGRPGRPGRLPRRGPARADRRAVRGRAGAPHPGRDRLLPPGRAHARVELGARADDRPGPGAGAHRGGPGPGRRGHGRDRHRAAPGDLRRRGRRLTSRLVEGEFPKFRSLIPSGYESVATLDRQVLLDALKQVTPVRPEQQPGAAHLRPRAPPGRRSLQDVAGGAASVDAKYEGEGITIAFNPVYLSDGVAAWTTTRPSSRSATASSRPSSTATTPVGFMYLLMPVRLPG
jgi:DNA polymerase-3 subunit beta